MFRKVYNSPYIKTLFLEIIKIYFGWRTNFLYRDYISDPNPDLNFSLIKHDDKDDDIMLDENDILIWRRPLPATSIKLIVLSH